MREAGRGHGFPGPQWGSGLVATPRRPGGGDWAVTGAGTPKPQLQEGKSPDPEQKGASQRTAGAGGAHEGWGLQIFFVVFFY